MGEEYGVDAVAEGDLEEGEDVEPEEAVDEEEGEDLPYEGGGGYVRWLRGKGEGLDGFLVDVDL